MVTIDIEAFKESCGISRERTYEEAIQIARSKIVQRLSEVKIETTLLEKNDYTDIRLKLKKGDVLIRILDYYRIAEIEGEGSPKGWNSIIKCLELLQ